MSRRSFLAGATAMIALPPPVRVEEVTKKQTEYESLRWVDEREDPSITLETEELVVKAIDNTGLRSRPGDKLTEQGFSHYFGYHGIRALWRKDERRNIVAPYFSWLNLQALRVDGLDLDPVDSRALAGVGRGWPMEMKAEDGGGIVLRIPRMPVSGIEYSFHVTPSLADSLDFKMTFVVHKKTRRVARFYASWPCYMSTYDEVELYSPSGNTDSPTWQAFGEKEPFPFVVGDSVNYVHRQRRFFPPSQPVFPAVYGRIGTRVLAIMLDRPEAKFFVVNTGGHRPFSGVQNPAWDFSLDLPDYEPEKPFGLRGRLLYKLWSGADEIVTRYQQWKLNKD